MEKRVYPRAEKPFFAIVENNEGIRLYLIAVNTSALGLCIKCSTFERNLITPGGRFVSKNGKPIELSLSLELPLQGGKPEKIKTRCQVVYSRRLSKSQCRIGLRYSELDRNVFETLTKYIDFVEMETA